MNRRSLAFACVLLIGCGNSATEPVSDTKVVFDLAADTRFEGSFFDVPFPSDARLLDGRPDLAGYPNPGDIKLLSDLVPLGEGRNGFSTNMASFFQFTGALSPRVETDVIAAEAASPILLIDVDPDSSERGRLIPTVARTLVKDDYVPENVLAVAPRPGFILSGERTYAMVIMKSLGDAAGEELGVSDVIRTLAAGDVPDGSEGETYSELYQPLWETLTMLSIDSADVAAATVYTTGDVVAELAELSDQMRGEYSVTIDGLEVDADDGDHERFCEVLGTVDFPQFQVGTPPFQSEGTFSIGDDGLPELQRTEQAGVVLTLPKGEMPVGGYPLAMYFHGSGGLYQQVVDRGRVTEVGGETTKGEGPAFVLAPHGFAMVGSAHPVNPERLPGADDIEYLNLNNLATLPFTFQQGSIEQRLLLDALLEISIPESALEGCTGMSLPSAEGGYRFAEEKIVAMGQSMGGMYTNIIGAIEPRIGAVIPTGAGGMWHLFILETSIVKGARGLLSVIFRTPEAELSYLHPVLQLLGLSWEVAEPMVYMPRLGRDPLPGHPARPVYEPAGEGDSYFPTVIYDAAALSYGNEQAGEEVWTSMQEGLALDGKEGFLEYPVVGNLMSSAEDAYTGVIVQYEGDGIYDPHAIYGQLDEVKYQYACFLETFVERGAATLPAPAPLGTPCP
ncbi:MAG: hypothetical protein GY811_03630 [Myxococcales bacterium]|nr:hypothetical protein [Myxococcales bacterium]